MQLCMEMEAIHTSPSVTSGEYRPRWGGEYGWEKIYTQGGFATL